MVDTVYMKSPVGPLFLEAEGGALIRIRFAGEISDGPAVLVPDGLESLTFGGSEILSPGGLKALAPDGPEKGREETPSVLALAACQLSEYCAGKRKTFELPLRPEGTEFQRRVWAALSEIPYGETRSYGQIAATIGNPGAGRAVGMANHKNPLPIVVPCHRVIGAGGSLTGYAGGLDIKRKLLELEGVL